MLALPFIHICCNARQLHTSLQKGKLYYISYNVNTTFFSTLSKFSSSCSISSSSSTLNSAASNLHSGNSDYYANDKKCGDASRIQMPRILFLGGGIVSYSTLSALHSRMYNIATTMISNTDCAVHTVETNQLEKNKDEDVLTEKCREHSSRERCERELALRHVLAEQVVQDHLVVICPSLPEPYTNIAEVVRKFRRQYPVLRFCVEKQLAVFPVDHHKSFAKSNLYKQMIGQFDVKDSRIPTVDVNKSNVPLVNETTSYQHAQEWKNNKQWRLSSYDLAVIVSFRYYLPNLLLSALPRVINVHPSLLPKYRGASPIESTLMHNEVRGGVSIIKLTPHQTLMDSGDVLLQKEIPIPLSMDVRSYFPLISQTISTTLCDVIFGKKESSIESLERENWEKEEQRILCASNDIPDKNSTQDLKIFTKCEAMESDKDSAETCSVDNICEIEQTHCDWPRTFEKLWLTAKAQTHTNYKHHKDDPYYAPLLPKHASAMQFEKQTALEVYGIWRAFVSYKHCATSSNALFDKFATPVGVQLLERIIHRKHKEFNKFKRHERQSNERHHRKQEKEHEQLQKNKEHEDIADYTAKKYIKSTALCSALYKSGVAELCNTCSFVHAVHPSLVSSKVQEEMTILSTAPTEIEVVAVDLVKQNTDAFLSTSNNSDNNDDDGDDNNTKCMQDEPEESCVTVVDKQCTIQLADITPGTCYFPLADAELGAIKCAEGWFYWTILHLKCAARPQKTDLLRQGLAMKKGVLYHNLFRSIPTQS